MALVMVAAGLACLGIGRLGEAAVGEARARTAADAAALAGAAGGRDEAARLAEANGARLRSFEEAGSDVRVEVAIDGERSIGPAGPQPQPRAGPGQVPPARATARARWEGPPAGAGPGGGGGHDVAPALRAALARAEALLGRPVPVVPAGPRALSVDVPADLVGELAAVAPRAGLCQPQPEARPEQFGVCAPPGFGAVPPG